jgi:hypothetical protein
MRLCGGVMSMMKLSLAGVSNERVLLMLRGSKYRDTLRRVCHDHWLLYLLNSFVCFQFFSEAVKLFDVVIFFTL